MRYCVPDCVQLIELLGVNPSSLTSEAEANDRSIVFVYAQHNVYHRHRHIMHSNDVNESHNTLACILSCEALRELNDIVVCLNTFSTVLEILKPRDKVNAEVSLYGRHLVDLHRNTFRSHSHSPLFCLRCFWYLVCPTA